jgi:hypothetical protein
VVTIIEGVRLFSITILLYCKTSILARGGVIGFHGMDKKQRCAYKDKEFHGCFLLKKGASS